MNITEYLDKDLLIKMIDLKYVDVRKHPELDLYILNYSKLCTFDWVWNDVTEKCRGLIVDGTGEIKARPFKKFYNYEEIEDKSVIPNLPYKVYEKMDGSLGILYWKGDVPAIATRGSFESTQAIDASIILIQKYGHIIDQIPKHLTFLFEIIYPDDQKVVNYGDTEDLFLLAVIDTNSGKEFNIDDFNHLFRPVYEYRNVAEWKKLRDEIDGDNREGFVIKFENNFRVKLKYEEYFDLHKLLYSITPKYILELLMDDKIDDLIVLKDKFGEYHWDKIENVIYAFEGQFYTIRIECQTQFRTDFDDRSQAAAYFKTCKYPSVMFAMYDGKDITSFIWKIIKKQFKNGTEENSILEVSR